ncbi:hypothetical protein JCM17960_31440 [Magnetospira thiophila]
MTDPFRFFCPPLRPMLFAAVVAGLLFPGTTGLAVTSVALEPSGKYEDAQKSFQAGDLRTAVIHLKNILSNDPDHLSARLLLGRIHLVVGDGESAEKELRKALEIGAKPVLVVEDLGEALLLQGKYQELLDDLRVAGWPQQIEAAVRTLRGRAYFSLRQLNSADQEFKAALELQPERGSASLGLARVLQARGQWDEAEALLRETANRYPTMAQAWFLRGELSRARGELETALGFYNKAVINQPRHLAARTYRAAVLIDLGAASQAEDDLSYVRKYDPNDPHLAYWYARFLAATGRPDEARIAVKEAADILRVLGEEILDRDPDTLVIAGLIFIADEDTKLAHTYLAHAIRFDPYNVFARKALGEMLSREKRYAEAVEVLRPASKLRPHDADLISSLARGLLREKKYTEANELLQRAIVLAPDRADLRARLGLSQIGSGDREAGLEVLREAVGSQADSLGPGVLLTMVHLRSGEFKEAIEAAKAALEQTPDNPELYNLMGAAQIGDGDREAARQSFTRALELNPEHRVSRINLARINMLQGKLDEAEADFQRLVNKNPFDVNALLALAEIADKRKNPEQRIKWLEKAVDVAPGVLGSKLYLIRALLENGEANKAVLIAREARTRHTAGFQLLETLGLAELAAGNPERAANAINGMSDFARDSAAAMRRVSQLQVRVGDPEGALRTLSSAVVTFPNHHELLIDIIKLENQMGKQDRARSRIEEMVRDQPERSIGWALLGDSRLRENDTQGALEAYEEAFSRTPNSSMLVRIFLAGEKLGQREAMLPRLSKWLVENPKDRLVRRTLVLGYINAKRLRDAIPEVQLLLADKPDSVEALNNLAWLYHETDDPRSLEIAEKAYALAPQSASVIDTLAWILVERGDLQRGLALLRDAYARGGDIPAIRYHLAATLAKLGRLDEARQELQGVIADARGAPLGSEVEALRKTLSLP